MSLILIIEDSPAMAEAAREALKTAGYDAACALTVAEGLICCQERRPDLIFTEYYLQDGSGLTFLEKVAKVDPCPPVVMATGCGREEIAAQAMALGAWTYLVKTEAYLRELPDLVRRFLGEWAARQAAKEKELLQRRMDSQNELAGWLAHNFKNILAASIGYLNLIDLHNPGQSLEKRLDYLRDSRKSQETALTLLEQLIRLTDAEAGEAERIIVAEVVDEAWEMVKSKVLVTTEDQYPERLEETKAGIGQVLFLNSARRLEPLNMVRADLSSIMEALLQNALEAVLGNSGQVARILVQAEMNQRSLEIMVGDNGRGMSEKIVNHAREPLFSTKGEVGVGLGLSLVSSLVLRHGGDLKLDSTPGSGTVVRLNFPL
ncbi:MAG: hybrid sensor histidine kinase/response regulator [Candidatus Adiutrix sp.]|nr:hybrid sensor histidine kinase/response regulator [Candidatus Adiutrix sp.]